MIEIQHGGAGDRPVTEDGLVSALQPIRQFVLAQALFTFMDTGLHEAVARAAAVPVRRLADERGMTERRLRGFLRYLANEGFVDLSADDAVSLTAQGAELARYRPWYTLLVGGYSSTFLQLGDVLRGERPYADRDSRQVGVGSCGISRFDALPMVRRLIARIPRPVGTVVDLGCGDGAYLVELCESLPGLRGLGIEVGESSVAAARDLVRERGLADRIGVAAGSVLSPPDLTGLPDPFCFVTAFVLQEALEQAGRQAVVDTMRETMRRHPDAYWIVVEVDHRPDDEKVMGHGLGLGYYNPYYLIHHITEQRLETRDFWEQVFAEAGLDIRATEVPDPSYDSLELKVGYLLRPAE